MYIYAVQVYIKEQIGMVKKEIWIWHKRNMAQLSASCAIFLCLTKNNFRNE